MYLQIKGVKVKAIILFNLRDLLANILAYLLMVLTFV